MPILPNGQTLPYNNMGGTQQQPRFSQPQGASPAPGTAQPQQGQQMDPRFEMWRRRQMQMRQAGNVPRFTQPMTIQDRMGMMGPGIAALRSGGQGLGGPTRQGIGGQLASPAGGFTQQDLVQRRGILPIG